jgi:histidinol phosphatase-like PHP family hydrolase
MFGLAGVCLVEHAPQLYVAPDDFWHARHVRVPGLWRKSPSARMEAYLREMCGRRSDYVRVGLEVEADVNGELILQPEHRAQVDLLVGAVHFLPKDDLGGRAANFDGVFLDANRKLLAHDVDILAHPTRMYGRRGHGLSDRVRHELVEMLVQTRTAAEINFHVQEPDREFFQLCVESGVKLAVASDAHVPEDMADLLPHVSFLKTLASGRPVEDLLWRFPCL